MTAHDPLREQIDAWHEDWKRKQRKLTGDELDQAMRCLAAAQKNLHRLKLFVSEAELRNLRRAVDTCALALLDAMYHEFGKAQP